MKMESTILISLLIIGVLAGILSGLIGVGGGVIMIPLLVFVLGYSSTCGSGNKLSGFSYAGYIYSGI